MLSFLSASRGRELERDIEEGRDGARKEKEK